MDTFKGSVAPEDAHEKAIAAPGLKVGALPAARVNENEPPRMYSVFLLGLSTAEIPAASSSQSAYSPGAAGRVSEAAPEADVYARDR